MLTSTRLTSTTKQRPITVDDGEIPIKSSKACPFVGSISMILAIMSSGAWFSQLLSSTLDSQIFLRFLKKLFRWIESRNRFDWDKVYHRSRQLPIPHCKICKRFLQLDRLPCILPTSVQSAADASGEGLSDAQDEDLETRQKTSI